MLLEAKTLETNFKMLFENQRLKNIFPSTMYYHMNAIILLNIYFREKSTFCTNNVPAYIMQVHMIQAQIRYIQVTTKLDLNIYKYQILVHSLTSPHFLNLLFFSFIPHYF